MSHPSAQDSRRQYAASVYFGEQRCRNDLLLQNDALGAARAARAASVGGDVLHGIPRGAVVSLDVIAAALDVGLLLLGGEGGERGAGAEEGDDGGGELHDD